MKILVITQYYWPEPFAVTDVCEELARRGHTVHVVTGVPNYPMGHIYDGYRSGKNRRQERNGVRITRTFTVGRRNSIVFRMLNYFSYAISSTAYVRRLKEEYDVVFVNQLSPITMVSAAAAYAKKRKKKTVLYCLDLWPASLAAGGVGKNSPVYKLFGRISDRLYHSADRILITSRMFRDYFREEFGITEPVVEYLPQYADDRFEAPAAPEQAPKDTVDLVFAGNIGAAQSIPTILQAAAALSHHPQLRWHIVGDGSELENCKRLARELALENVIFHGRHPMEEMPRFYAMADAMLVTLTADPVISMTLPGKVQSCMAFGKPILAAADGEIPRVIEAAGCGFCAPAGDAQALAEAVEKFLLCPDRHALAQASRQYYADHFTRKTFMDTLERELRERCG